MQIGKSQQMDEAEQEEPIIDMNKRKTKLKLSVLDLVPVYENRNDTYALQQAVKLAQKAEQLGYERYWVAEHHDMERLACPAPEILLAHIGARTERIRIGSGALLLPHYSPLKVAETFRMLATLYPGRIDLGMGRAPGGNAHTSMALSGNFLENVRQMPQKLDDVINLMQDQYTYEGEPVRARPYPPEQPELWLLGTNKKSAEYAAKFGLGYTFGQFMSDTDALNVLQSYRQAFVASPLCSRPKTIVTIGVVCANTEDEAKELALAGGTMSREQIDRELALPPTKRKLLIGTAHTILSTLQQLADLYEVNEWMLVAMIADYEKRLRSYELLAEQIWPYGTL